MPCYLYILGSQKDSSFYIGVLNNIVDRIKRHNSGKSNYTKSRGPWILRYYKYFSSKSEAMKEEKKLKKMKSKLYIENLIKLNNNT